MSSKLSKNNKQGYKMSKNDAVFYRTSSLFFILCAVVLFIVRIMDTASLRLSTGRNIAYTLYSLFRNPIYIGAISILLVGSLAWMIVSKVKKIDESRKILTSVNAVTLVLYVIGFSLYYGSSGGRTSVSESVFALTVTIVLGLIYFISKIYHKDFLVFSIENAILSLLLYRYFEVVGTKGIIGKILLIAAALIIGIVIVRKFRFAEISRKVKIKRYTLMSFPYFVTLAIWSVSMFLNGVDVISRGMLLAVMLIQYILFAIVYTIKLIRE